MRPQQQRISWPLTPEQVEGMDNMFETLFRGLRPTASGTVVTSGQTPAQIAARVLLDAPENAVAFGSGSASSAASTGVLGPPGFDGEDGDSYLPQRQQVFDGEMRAVTSQVMSWNVRSVNTVYQAASDGLIVVFWNSTSGVGANLAVVTVLSDTANPPVTNRTVTSNQVATSSQQWNSSVMCPVRKGDFYKVATTNVGGEVMFWVPLGTAG